MYKLWLFFLKIVAFELESLKNIFIIGFKICFVKIQPRASSVSHCSPALYMTVFHHKISSAAAANHSNWGCVTFCIRFRFGLSQQYKSWELNTLLSNYGLKINTSTLKYWNAASINIYPVFIRVCYTTWRSKNIN